MLRRQRERREQRRISSVLNPDGVKTPYFLAPFETVGQESTVDHA